MGKTIKKLLRAVANYDPEYYDMHADTNESLFAQLYVAAISEQLDQRGIQPPATILEAGCQAGRLIAPFASQGYRVTGIDRSGFAVRRAQQNLKQLGLEAECIKSEFNAFIESSQRVFDAVICAEVIYLSDDPEAMLRTLGQSVKPGGLLCVSHRLKAYYLLQALRCGEVELAHRIMNTSGGRLTIDGSEGTFNWQDPEELSQWYAGIGFKVLQQVPIDRYAWLTNLDLQALDTNQQALWLELETQTQHWTPGLARYQLVIATPEAT